MQSKTMGYIYILQCIKKGNNLCLTEYNPKKYIFQRPSFCTKGSKIRGEDGWRINKILGFRWSKKAKTTLRNYRFFAKQFYQ